MGSEFRSFLTKTNALALAIGVIIGAAIGKVVSALVDDILMPVISLGIPGGDWRKAQVVLSRSVDATGKVTENSILYGHFIGTLLDFIIIAVAVFLITKALIKPATSEPTRKCPECLESIPLAARRCRACTAAVAAS